MNRADSIGIECTAQKTPNLNHILLKANFQKFHRLIDFAHLIKFQTQFFLDQAAIFSYKVAIIVHTKKIEQHFFTFFFRF